jgi:hypothetical protein
MLSASKTADRKESQVEIRSLLLRQLPVVLLALLALFGLAAITTAQPAEAAPRTAVAVAQDDDDGGDDDDGDDGREDDDDDGGSSAGRGGDDDDDDTKGGVRDVPSGGVDTGAGGTAAGDSASSGSGVPYLITGGVLLVGAVAALVRRVNGGADA